MNGMVKAWLATITIFIGTVVIISFVHYRHGSIILSTFLAVVAVPVCAMIGERLFRVFNPHGRSHDDNE